MKPLLTLLLLCLLKISNAQKTEYYLDFNRKPCEPGNARFYGTLEKTDSGWLNQDYYVNNGKVHMRVLYADSTLKIHNGTGLWFHPNGVPRIVARWVNNRKEGLALFFHSNGMIVDSAYYHLDKRIGARHRFHPNGYMADSIYAVNDSMEIQISWFDNGSISHAGYLKDGERHGKWKFFHRNGTLAGYEQFFNGHVIKKEYFNEDGSLQPDTAKANAEASFKNGGENGWRKYLAKSLYWPRNLELTNTNSVTIGISFTINEEGKTEDVEVYVPFHPEFEKIAIRIIRNSPAWNPAISNNRRVKQYYRQPVTFAQE